MDQISLYILVAIAGSATFVWAVLDRRPTLMTAVSAGVWSMIALGGSEMTRYTQNGEPYTVVSPWIQYVALFFAAISFFALFSFKRDWVPAPDHHRRKDDLEA